MSGRPNLVAVVGQQRSGTTVLRQLLGGYPSAVDLGEIFSGWTDYRSNFWGFIGRIAREKMQFVCPHYWYDAWEEYILDMKDFYRVDNFIFDMKVEYMGHVLRHDPFSNPHRSNYFFSWNKLNVIYLERKNVAAQVISRKLAEETNDWGWRDGTASDYQLTRHDARFQLASETINSGLSQASHNPDASGFRLADQDPDSAPLRSKWSMKKIYIDPRLLEEEITSCISANQFASNSLERFKPLCVYYEDLFSPDGFFTDEIIKNLSQFLSFDVAGLSKRPVMRKQSSGDVLDRVLNRDEVMSHFEETPFRWMMLEG